MITSEVKAEQLAEWKTIYAQKKDTLKPNRIDGYELNEYFKSKYTPDEYKNDRFRDSVYQNAREYDQNTSATNIVTYVVGDDIFVGIDLHSGYFDVECAEIAKAIPIWDDLFVRRGLNENDLSNYVVTAQYMILTEKNSDWEKQTEKGS